MRVTYDVQVDAMYIYLHDDPDGPPGNVTRTEELTPSIMIDYDKDGKPLGVEILNAAQHFPKTFRGIGA